MSTIFSQIKLAAIGCLSITALVSTMTTPTAHAEDLNYGSGYSRGHEQSNEHIYSYEDTQETTYDRREIYRRNSGGYGRRSQRLCLEFRQSIAVLEKDRNALLRRHHYNSERLYFIEKELRYQRAEYLRACR